MKVSKMSWKTVLSVVIISSVISINALAISAHIGGNAGVGTANKHVDTGLALHGYLEVDATPNAAIRGTMMYYGGDTKVDVLSEGDFQMLGPELSLILKFPYQQIVPYIGAGVGIYITENDLSSRVNRWANQLGVRVKEDINTDVGFHAVGGISVNLTPNIALDFNAKYLYLKPDVKAKATNLYTFQSATVKDDVNLSTLFLTGGLKITF